MPLYDYECGACGHTFETQQGIKEKRLDLCPKCGLHELMRLISNTNFVLDGSGWADSGYDKWRKKRED